VELYLQSPYMPSCRRQGQLYYHQECDNDDDDDDEEEEGEGEEEEEDCNENKCTVEGDKDYLSFRCAFLYPRIRCRKGHTISTMPNSVMPAKK